MHATIRFRPNDAQAAVLPTADIHVGPRIKKPRDIERLAQSIEETGLRTPISVTVKDGRFVLLAGARRLEAVRLLGRDEIPAHLIDPENMDRPTGLLRRVPLELRVEISEEAEHDSFVPSELYAAYCRLLPYAKEEAKERQRQGGRLKASAKLAGVQKGNAIDLIAQALNTSRGTLKKIVEVYEAAAKNSIFQAFAEEMDADGKVDAGYQAFRAAIKKAKSDARHDEIIANARKHDLAKKRYPILLVDPPWDVPLCRGAQPYPTLSISKICEFRVDDGRLVRDVASDDAILFLWFPGCLVFELPQILAAWGGWTLRHFLCWPKFPGTPGGHALFQHESVAVCTRGNFPLPNILMTTLITQRPLDTGNGFYNAPAHDARHSSKPDRLYEMIEQHYPQYFGPETNNSPLALELFARNYRPKWDGQGYEYPGRLGRIIEVRSESTATLLSPRSEIDVAGGALDAAPVQASQDDNAEQISR
jgi:N6-adenosine-specific RNA methylase IME4